MSFKLVVDERERAVVPFLENYSSEYHLEYEVKTLQVGDYAIVYKGYIMIIIERKTWVDLAQSMRDGRKENINKLMKLREDTGCQIAYLIEGPMCSDPNKTFGRVPYKALRSSLDHLSFRDGVHMLYSKNQDDSARRMFELMRNYSTIEPSPFKEIDEAEAKNNEVTGSNEEKLTEKQISTINIQEMLMRCLPKVGTVLSTKFAENGITLYKLYSMSVSADDIARFKYPGGASVGLDTATKIMQSVKYMHGENAISHKIQIRIMTAIPLISVAAANAILTNISFSDIMDGKADVKLIAKIPKTDKKTIGIKAATNLIKFLVEQVDTVS